MNGMGGNAYQIVPPDLQAVMDATSQQPTGTSSTPMPVQPVGATLASQAAQMQQLNAQQQQQLAAVAFATAANPMALHTLSALPSQLAQFGLPMGLPTFQQQPSLMAQLLTQQNPGHSDMSHITLPLDQLKQSAKPEPVSRSIQRSRSETGASSAYASRHQAAEQRRRTRINERWGAENRRAFGFVSHLSTTGSTAFGRLSRTPSAPTLPLFSRK